jgi:hypothetical protein
VYVFPTSLLSSAQLTFYRAKLLPSDLFNLLLYLQTVIITNAGRRACHSQMDTLKSKGPQVTNCSHLNHRSPKRNHNSSRHHLQYFTRTIIYTCIASLPRIGRPDFTLRILIVCRANRICRVPQESTACFTLRITLSILSVYACSRCACIPVPSPATCM